MSGSVSFFPSFKVCTKCGKFKALTDFGLAKHHTDGRSSHCKACAMDASRRRRLTSPRLPLALALVMAKRRRPTEHPISIDELLIMWGEQNGKCAITGVEMSWSGKAGRVSDLNSGPLPNSMTMDRIDQSRGYETGNVRLVCSVVNSLRGSMSDDEMWGWVRTLAARCPPQ